MDENHQAVALFVGLVQEFEGQVQFPQGPGQPGDAYGRKIFNRILDFDHLLENPLRFFLISQFKMYEPRAKLHPPGEDGEFFPFLKGLQGFAQKPFSIIGYPGMKIGQAVIRIDLQGFSKFLEGLVGLPHGPMQTDRPGIIKRHERVELQSFFDFPDRLVKPSSV